MSILSTVKKAGSTISRFSKKLFLYILPIVGVATLVATPANAFYRLTYEQASAIINTTNTNVRGETAANYVKWTNGRTATNQTNKYLQGGSTVTALTLSTIDTDPVTFDGREWYRKYKNYVNITGTQTVSISQPYIVATFVLTLEDIAEDWTLYVIAPYNASGSEYNAPLKVGYTSWGAATNGNANYSDVTFYELTAGQDYTVMYSYQQYASGNAQYAYRMGVYEIHLPAGDIGSVNIIYDATKMQYNFTLGVSGIDGSNLVQAQIIEQLTQIQQNQQTIITYQQTIANNITRITIMSESEASEVAALKAKYSAITSNMESLMQAADDAMDDIHEILPDIEDLDPGIFDLQDYAPGWDNQEYLAPLQNAFQWSLITTMLVLSLVVAGLSYILFGKKA